MSKKIRKILSLLLAFAVASGTVGIGTTSVYAAKHSWELGGDFDDGIVYAGQPDIGFAVYDQNSDNWLNASVTAVKSSNTKILNFKRHKYMGEYFYDVTARKAGTVSVKFKFRTPEGTYQTIKRTIRVRKYPNCMKSLKVLGKAVDLKSNKYGFEKKTSRTSVGIKAALQNGWKINYAFGTLVDLKKGDLRSEKEIKITKKMLSTGSAVKFPKKYEEMYVSLDLEKNGQSLWYQIHLHR